jgi:hypothetical protein
VWQERNASVYDPGTYIGPPGYSNWPGAPGDFPARQAHLTTPSRYAEQKFRARLTARGQQPRVPVPVMARAFTGAHVAILEAWPASSAATYTAAARGTSYLVGSLSDSGSEMGSSASA